MSNGDKFDAIQKLAALGLNGPGELEADILQLIVKVIGPWRANELGGVAPTVDEMLKCKHEGKIQAIKAHRLRTGCGLKESKDAIESAMERLGIVVTPIFAPSANPEF